MLKVLFARGVQGPDPPIIPLHTTQDGLLVILLVLLMLLLLGMILVL